MKIKIILLILIFLIISCQNDNGTIYINQIHKQENTLIMDVVNNSGQDYYILNPSIDVYTMGGAYMIKTELITNHFKNKKIDSLICKVFTYDCLLNVGNFSQVVKLPKNSIIKLKYKSFENFDEHNVEYIPTFPYNINHFQNTIWFSYRKNIPGIGNDTGWGCMIRSVMMIIAEALKRTRKYDFSEILKLF